jgi:hypothetical protein
MAIAGYNTLLHETPVMPDFAGLNEVFAVTTGSMI